MPALLAAEEVSKIYQMGSNNVTALDNVSLEVNEGEFVAIQGTSGSGKSTLLNMLGGLDHPTKGEVYFASRPLGPFTARWKRGRRGRPSSGRGRSWKAWLPPLFEEVYGTHTEHVGHLLERVGTAATLVLQPPHRARRQTGPLRQLALREPLVDPQLL